MISVTRNSQPKLKPAVKDLGFGKYFSDHMFQTTFTEGRGWHSARITPYENLQIPPGASVLHYGQALFEGMKAFRQTGGDDVLFRPEFNWKRISDGAERLCMQVPPTEMMQQGLLELLRIDRDWIPSQKGASLYIRPTLIGMEPFLGVRPSGEYLFFIICSPVASYYAEGTAPIKIWVEDTYVRAATGGLGATKAGANYASSLKAALEAKKRGYAQVLWQDVTHEYVEEVGTMNVFFVFENEVVTPALGGSILPGKVRDSVLTLLKEFNIPVIERRLSMKEVRSAFDGGKLKEVFGTGTAAVISPVGELASPGYKMVINEGKTGPLATRLYDELTSIQYGDKPDSHGWLSKI
jgi:branched-chain amino acid aminotransferase